MEIGSWRVKPSSVAEVELVCESEIADTISETIIKNDSKTLLKLPVLTFSLLSNLDSAGRHKALSGKCEPQGDIGPGLLGYDGPLRFFVARHDLTGVAQSLEKQAHSPRFDLDPLVLFDLGEISRKSAKLWG